MRECWVSRSGRCDWQPKRHSGSALPTPQTHAMLRSVLSEVSPAGCTVRRRAPLAHRSVSFRDVESPWLK